MHHRPLAVAILGSVIFIALTPGPAGASTVTNTPLTWCGNTGWAAGGTSPAFTWLYAVNSQGYEHELAYQGTNTHLIISGTISEDTGLGMRTGTSPAITALNNGGFEVAFQANTGDLWIAGSIGNLSIGSGLFASDLGFGMLANSSPSITAIGSGYETAFQSNNRSLWVAGSAGTANWGLGMADGTSPSIASVNGSYQVAIQANSGHLWEAGVLGTGDSGLVMAKGTSPAIDNVVYGNGAEVAYQNSAGQLAIAGSVGSGNWGYQMAAGTSPALIISGAYGQNGVQTAFQAPNGHLWLAGSLQTGDTGLVLQPGTNPTLAP